MKGWEYNSSVREKKEGGYKMTNRKKMKEISIQFLLKSFRLSSNNIFYILIFIITQYSFHQICLFESKHYARNFPYLTFKRTFHAEQRNKRL